MHYVEFEWDSNNELKVTLRASLEEIESAFYDPKKKIIKTIDSLSDVPTFNSEKDFSKIQKRLRMTDRRK
ncbi:MAG: hypothetical protein HYR97_07920 [Candidatus Melainabacteria bacterium]|nr:hypothetical protein [Candidatus Melainabacteria bacterium]MBI3308407.1 hypothetical protein [Candidatus Melainabacteria bacterium]